MERVINEYDVAVGREGDKAIHILQDWEFGLDELGDGLFGHLVVFNREFSGIGEYYYDPDAYVIDLACGFASEEEEEFISEYAQYYSPKCKEYQEAWELIYRLIHSHIIARDVFIRDWGGGMLDMYSYNSTNMGTREWERGQAGYIYCTVDEAKKEFGEDYEKKALDAMGDTIEEMGYVLKGEVYGYVLYDGDNMIDSCFGFVGEYPDVLDSMGNYMPKEYARLLDNVELLY